MTLWIAAFDVVVFVFDGPVAALAARGEIPTKTVVIKVAPIASCVIRRVVGKVFIFCSLCDPGKGSAGQSRT